MQHQTALTSFMSICLFSAAANGVIIHVDDSAAGGANNGTSWNDAFVNLHQALAVAQGGDEIRIGQGTYKPAGPNGNRTATFLLVNSTLVQGGYAGTGAANPDALDPTQYPTVLSGDLNGNDGPNFANYADNSYHVVTAKATNTATRLHGVTVRAGNASVSEGLHQFGGGILCLDAHLTLRDCIIEDNQAFRSGGGIDGWSPSGQSTLWMERCIIRRNRHTTALGGSGGVAAGAGSTFIDCTFQFNHAPMAGSGAGLSTTNSLIESCVFDSNQAAEDGGALIGGGNVVKNCEFRHNASGVFGGAIQGGGLTVENCVFEDNFSGVGGAIQGGGVIRDCHFIANWAGDLGGAFAGSGTIVNCTFLGNYGHPSGVGEGGAIYGGGEVINCLFSGNRASTMGSAVLGSGQFTNCTFVGNRLTYPSVNSGAFHNWQNGHSVLKNCIVFFNEANGPQTFQSQITVESGSVTVHHCAIQGWDGSLPGQNNFGNDPQFIDADGPDGQYGTLDDNPRLSNSSPCRDTGNNVLLPNDAFDLDGDGNTNELLPIDLEYFRRIVNGTVDRGAFEWQRPEGCEADVSPSSPGIAGDGSINVNDLLTVINAWGACDQCVADINGDGQVNVNDLLAVINSWGRCP